MISEYEVKIIEGEKSVKQEIKVRGDNEEEVAKATISLYNRIQPFCLEKSIKKMR